MTTSDAVSSRSRSLRERIPEYLKLFGMGLLGSAGFAAIVAGLSSAGLGTALGNTLIVLGIGMLFVGGLRGGGYAHLSSGAIDTVLKKTSRHHSRPSWKAHPEGPGTMASNSPPPAPPPPPPPPPPPAQRSREGGRKGRYEPNPKAFWQVIAGFAYIGLGAVIVLRFAS